LFFGASQEIFGRDASKFIVSLGVMLATIGFLQLIIWPVIPVSYITKYGFDPHNHRLFATFFDPNFVASLLVITTIVTTYRLNRQFNKLDLVACLVQLLAIAMTGSRSGWLALIVAVTLYILATDRKYLWLLISVAMTVFLFSPQVANRVRSALALDVTVQARFASWQTASQIINITPITGVGYNNYAAAAESVGRFYPRVGQIALAANGSDSSWLTIWATTGLFGLITFFIFLCQVIWQKEAGLDQAMRLAVIGGLIINSWFINSLLFVFTLFLLSLVISIEHKV